MTVYLLPFILFLLPFLILPFGISPFESGKVVIGEACLFLFFLTTINGSLIRNIWKTQRIICLLYGIIILVSLIDLLFLRTPSTFLGTIYRGQGVLLLWLLLLFSLTSSNVQMKMASLILKGLIILQLALSLLISPSLDGRFIGSLGEPNSLAGFILFLWPFALLSNTKRNKVIDLLLFLFVVFMLVGTGSRSGLIGLSLQLLFFLLYRFLQLSFTKSTMIVFILLFASLVLPFFDHTSVYESRSLIWQTAFVSGLQSPIWGHGFGNIQSVLHSTSQQLHNVLRKENIDSSHNLILDWFVQAGSVGVIFIVTLIATACKRMLSQKNDMLFLPFLGIMSIMFFNPVSIVLLIAFWWILGQAILQTGK